MSRPGREGGITFDFQVIESPYAPQDSVLIVPTVFDFKVPASAWWFVDVWPPAPPSFSEVAALERARALAHLAGLLDDWCVELGFDPDEVWRAPRKAATDAATWASNHRTYMAEERLALSIVNPRTSAIITNC